MLIKKLWSKRNKFGGHRNYTGWFLFGFLPIYIKMSDWH
jgi:hypothetical protein